MSARGIEKFAEAIAYMQGVRIDLIASGSADNDHQDLRLAQLLQRANDAIKKEFCQITLMDNRHDTGSPR